MEISSSNSANDHNNPLFVQGFAAAASRPEYFSSLTFATVNTTPSPARNTGSVQRRTPQRPARAQQACTVCRDKKTKCDGRKPVCGKCSETGARCEYSKLPQNRKFNDSDGCKAELVAIKRGIDQLDETANQISARILQNIRGMRFRGPPLVNGQRQSMRTPLSTEQKYNEEELFSADLHNEPALVACSMPFRHSTAAQDLSKHYPAIKSFDEKGTLRWLRTRGRRTSVPLQTNINDTRAPLTEDNEHLPSIRNHCTSDCASHCVRIPDYSADEIFESFLNNIYVLHPFVDVRFAQKLLKAISANDNLPLASAQSRSLNPARCNPRTGVHFNSSTSREEKSFWVNHLDEPTALLMFALGSICRRQFGACRACCIPGLECFTRATRILGSYSTSTELQYVNAYLLAALYLSQLNEPEKSAGCIRSASLALDIFLQQNPRVIDPDEDDEEVNQIRISYWTWFQLESDLLAEMFFTPSDIFRYADDMPLPRTPTNLPSSISSSTGFAKTMMCYREQILLRKILNRIHSTLYPPLPSSPTNQASNDSSSNVVKPKSELDMTRKIEVAGQFWREIEEWRKNLPPQLKWVDSERPASDINGARLRGKYYGACVITTRPCLERVRQAESEEANESNAVYSELVNALNLHGDELASGTPSSISTAKSIGEWLKLPYQVVLQAIRCIEASKLSTTAFDGIPGMPSKLNVTNIFGTMQAQYGNIMVLASMFIDTKHLQGLITKGEMDYLLKRTIKFLVGCGWNTERVQRNIVQLCEVQRVLDENPGRNTERNFVEI